jgi:serine phosphatase RsbU (regulator of sigma subunit)/pSer/pThr/pTyr-binding forkhead associated (FHA) protein
LVLVDGVERRTVLIDKLPFTIGRKPDNDLVLSGTHVSRQHATITREATDYWLTDLDSKHGMFVNGQKVARHRLQPNDRLEFGTGEGMYLLFVPLNPPATGELLGAIQGLATASDLEKLSLLLEAARKLNGTRVLGEVLPTLLELTLRLTRAERAYIFLREADGRLRLAAGRDAQGRPLADDSKISRSILHESAASGCEFLLTDTSRFHGVEERESIVAFDLRTVICIPLSAGRATEQGADGGKPTAPRLVRGVLYLDSHFASQAMTAIGDDVLRALAREATSLIENTYLVQAEEAARAYQQELAIAFSIQQNLMNVTVPDVDFAAIQGRSVPCLEIGGDFFDVAHTSRGLAVIVADVSGKGISAALLASILQGLIYSQLMANIPLVQIAAAVNLFLCQKRLEGKYATLVLALLTADGKLETVNCGHLPPLLVPVDRPPQFLEGSNLPVGLFRQAAYESTRWQLEAGDRLLFYTDGVTEAANAEEEFFGSERLQQAAGADSPLDDIFADLTRFCAGAPASDDCTLVDVRFTPPAAGK